MSEGRLQLRSWLRAAMLGAAHAMLLVGSAAAQVPGGEAPDAYYRAVGGHFGVPPDEVIVLSEWRLSPEEIPVVLFIARRGGISPDAVVAQRQGGASWSTVARRYALDAESFHVRLEGGAGSLAPVYAEFAARPQSQWSAIQLADADLVALVNLRVLAEVLGSAPGTVLQAHDRAGSWVGAYRTVAQGR